MEVTGLAQEPSDGDLVDLGINPPAFHAVIQHLTHFATTSPFSPWLYRCYNISDNINLFRRRSTM